MQWKARVLYLFTFSVCIWLALTTRSHSPWFHSVIQKYGGDVIWAGAFLFLLKTIFIRSATWKLAIICYLLGVLNEFSQLLMFDWIVAIRSTYFGRLMLGVGFVWSDLLCYAIGTALAWICIAIVQNFMFGRKD
jgi:hypothetical protein